MGQSRSFKSWILAGLVLGLIAVHAAQAQPTTPSVGGHSAVEQQVLDFEKARCDALLHRDIPALNRMMADDVVYVHASGFKQTKSEYLAYIAAGKVTFVTYAIVNPTVRVVGDAAVTHGIFNYEVSSNQPIRKGTTIYTGVYARKNGQWRLENWQSTLVK